jgi:NAD-dependent deacetylase
VKKVVVFTGAGISAESGLRTFRDSDGLWEEYRITDVATPQAWEQNRELVQQFYNERRKQVLNAKPNNAHYAIAKLEQYFNVIVVTQNIDNLHEKAGSTNIIHLHGEITKAQSTGDPQLVYDIDGWELSMAARCEKGFNLRPFIVWFGEPVPKMEEAIHAAALADIFIVIGTSLEVYPAANLINFVTPMAAKYLIDPAANAPAGINRLTVIREKAGIAVPALTEKIIKENDFN